MQNHWIFIYVVIFIFIIILESYLYNYANLYNYIKTIKYIDEFLLHAKAIIKSVRDPPIRSADFDS